MGYAAVYIAEFPAVVCLREQVEWHSVAFAVIEGKAPLQKIASLNDYARAMGLVAGMSKVQAETAGLTHFSERSFAAEETVFANVCEIGCRFSPRIQVIAGPANNYAEQQAPAVSIVLDQTGTESLFGTATQYARRLRDALAEYRFHASVAITSNAQASLLLSRTRQGVTSIEGGQLAASLSGLPVSLLPCEEATLRVLARWGIRTLGELAALPETALISRIGTKATQLQRMAVGREEHLLVPEPEPFLLEEKLCLDTPLDIIDSLLFVLSPMLGRLMHQAIAHAYAVRSIKLTLTLDKQPPHILNIRPALPTQNRELLLKLVHLDLQTRSPGAAILELVLSAEAAKPQTAQRGLFQAQFPDPDKLELLVARLRSMAGQDNVGSPELRNTHGSDEFGLAPYQPAVSANASPGPREPARLSLRRIRPPQAVRVTLRDGRPVMLYWQGQRWTVAEAKGPWQSSGYWWDHRCWAAEEWDALVSAPLQHVRLRHEVTRNAWLVDGVYD